MKKWKDHPLQLKHAAPQARLRFKATSEKRDILFLENQHAAFRRRNRVRQVQNPGEELTELIVEFTVPKIVARRSNVLMSDIHNTPSLTLETDTEKSVRAGNVWNLFVKKMTSNTKGDHKAPPDTRPVWEAYHALSDDEFKALQKEVDEANLARDAHEDRDRRRVFGKKTRCEQGGSARSQQSVM